MSNLTPKWPFGKPWVVTLTSNRWKKVWIRLFYPSNPRKVVLLIILTLSELKLWLNSNTGGRHIGFCQYGGPVGRPTWRPPKIEKVWYRLHMGQIWCFWKNVNQTFPIMPLQPRLCACPASAYQHVVVISMQLASYTNSAGRITMGIIQKEKREKQD